MRRDWPRLAARFCQQQPRGRTDARLRPPGSITSSIGPLRTASPRGGTHRPVRGAPSAVPRTSVDTAGCGGREGGGCEKEAGACSRRGDLLAAAQPPAAARPQGGQGRQGGLTAGAAHTCRAAALLSGPAPPSGLWPPPPPARAPYHRTTLAVSLWWGRGHPGVPRLDGAPGRRLPSCRAFGRAEIASTRAARGM